MVRTDALDGPFEAAARPKQASGKLQEKLAALEAAHNAGRGKHSCNEDGYAIA